MVESGSCCDGGNRQQKAESDGETEVEAEDRKHGGGSGGKEERGGKGVNGHDRQPSRMRRNACRMEANLKSAPAACRRSPKAAQLNMHPNVKIGRSSVLLWNRKDPFI